MELETINNEDLISLFRERQCLWDLSSEEYKNRNLKKDSWKDVCQQLFKKFEDMNDQEKNETCKYCILLVCIYIRFCTKL